MCKSAVQDRGLINGSVQFSHSVVSDSLRPHELQHARPPCSSPTPGGYKKMLLRNQMNNDKITISCHLTPNLLE